MTDDDDWLGLRDPEETRAAIGPALVVPAQCGTNELRALDEMRLDHDPAVRDHWRLVFMADENDNWEDEARSPLATRQCEIWRVRMGWPVGTMPTPADASAWLANRRAVLFDKWSPRLAWARAQDEAIARGEEPDPRAERPNAKF